MSVTSEIRLETAKAIQRETKIVKEWWRLGFITKAEALKLLRTPDGFSKLDEILSPEETESLAKK